MEKDEKKYVPNDVFKFRVSLKWDFTEEDITIFTKPFPQYPSEGYKTEEEYQKFIDSQIYSVQEKYFTQQRIDELKEKFIQKIRESENPFSICCVDMDGGYNVTEEELFDLEKSTK